MNANDTVIGGHRGLDVIRVHGGHYFRTEIEKRANHDLGNSGDDVGVDLYERNVRAVLNEAHALTVMDGSKYTPALFRKGDDFIVQEDLGETESPKDAELWRRNCIRMLATIRSRGLRHGDLKGSNIITKNDWPYAIDWQESHVIGKQAPQKQPFSDSYLLMQHIEGTYDVNHQLDTPRVARRWRAVLGDLGATMNMSLPLAGKWLIDLGCFQGDFTALAAAEGMTVMGVDAGGFRSGENSIAIAIDHWRDFPFGELMFLQSDILDIASYKSDVVLLFSTWPYVVNDYGKEVAIQLLRKIVHETGVLYFETQLYGDGPGPEFLKTTDDIIDMFKTFAEATPIATFPVTGRPASRTVFRVKAQ